MGVGKRAFVTFLAGDGDYVKGVVGLAKGLRKANTRYPLVVAVLPDVPDDPRRILRSQGCIVREIEPFYPPESQTKFVRAYFVINYSKLRLWECLLYHMHSTVSYLDSNSDPIFLASSIVDGDDNWDFVIWVGRCCGSALIWGKKRGAGGETEKVDRRNPSTSGRRNPSLHRAQKWINAPFAGNEIVHFVEYEKMMYLDADIQVFDNVDNIFDSPNGYFYAVMDCFCDNEVWCNSPQHKIGYCQQRPERVQWPAEMGSPPPLYFNAGMFVFEPNLVTYSNLLETVKITTPTTFAEQDFLNMYFKDVYKPISNVYNLLVAMLWFHPENVEIDKVKVVHYSADGAKPWRYTGKEAHMDREDIKLWVKKWWDIYEDESLDYENTTKNIVENGEIRQTDVGEETS
ncbi:hypothetical protein L484_026159 [Morus notabilis]|uniref:Hexosyltransferase n=1 Tax=Morus notabilis TaxID=981085 RepID=W9R858_9ROSA|nr:hypothetical protein L484_026159 [Morus notabilis]